MSARADSNIGSAFEDLHRLKVYHKGRLASTFLYTVYATNLCVDRCEFRLANSE